jgi:hypothetical protein
MTIRTLALALATVLALPSAHATSPTVIRSTGQDCISVVTDLLPSVRRGGQILVDGTPVLERDERQRPRVVRETLLDRCANDRRVVEIRIEPA